ncbi:ATP-binding protein [Sphingobacterium olei]|uniref:ATP-binding protein n=1 Tax=Sphingobacterium olei TaxID=2571155 RepID=A0A4U0P6C4_9SPHI|nr:ATP-binding protein [Sphingobacterium olei]TJZ63001.1 ATP-binding protein [Sphingobacterium olei]
MRNSLGNPARGDAFYPRDKEINKLYRALKSGASIYLSAPRRVGKTSILKYMEENPQDGYYFVYIITESVDSGNEFFKIIFEALLNSDAINALSKASANFRDFVLSIMDRVKKIYNVELRERDETDYYDILVELFSNVKRELGQLVVQIDEFPQTIQNILNTEGRGAAERFIQKNRALRHHPEVAGKIQFIYTGSLSLYPMVEQVTQLTAVNDLRAVELQALSVDEANDFLQRLLGEESLTIKMDLLQYVLDKMKWYIPFHLQLIAQELIEVYEVEEKEIDVITVDKAFEQVVHVRNRAQFEPYFARLNSVFKGPEHAFVLDVLKYVALYDQIDEDVMVDLGVKHAVEDMQRIKNIVEGDGYLYYSQEDRVYRYTSPILQLWCRRHMCR